MKPKQSLFAICVAAAVFLSASANSLFAQAWSINGNAGIAAGTNYLGTSDPNDLVFRSNAIERGRLFGTGEWRFGTAANNAQFDLQGRLTFTGSGAYRVGGNRYAFQYTGDPDYGLYFNSTDIRYEFRNGTALPLFYINANTGAIRIGDAYTLPPTDGTNNQVLKTNGAGVLTWSADNNTTYSAGTGLSLVGTTFNNTAPDQTVTLSGINGITTSGAYPNFTVNGANLWRTTGNAGTSTATNFIGTTDAVALIFRTSNTEKMRLGTDGKLSIGTTAPSARLHINSTLGEDALRIQTNGTTRLFVDDAGGVSIGSLTPGPAAGLYVSGNVGLGITTPANKLDVSGNIGLTGSLLFTNASAGSGLTLTDGQSIRDNSTTTTLEVELHGDWLPDTDNSHSLGNSAQRWIDVWALDGTINTSDLRDKSNIKDLRYGLKEIMQLRPVSFNWKNLQTKHEKLGVIAQELQKVMPETVRDFEYKVDEATGKREQVPSARLGVMYSDLIPVLIRGMQEQQKEINDLKALVAQLVQNAGANAASQTGAVTNARVSSAVLEQNVPNPLNGSTSIRYSIPAGTKNASLLITDMSGKSLKQIPLNREGAGVINVETSTLNAGTYSYALIIDGKQVDSKKMIIAR